MDVFFWYVEAFVEKTFKMAFSAAYTEQGCILGEILDEIGGDDFSFEIPHGGEV